jgi:hypothetical protein
VTASFAEQEIWHVMIARDDLKRMNVDQLDDAFRLDIVDTSTLVWKQGMDSWRSLGSIAGIDDEPETVVRVPPPRSVGPRTAPPPPRPQPRPIAPAVNPFAATVNPFTAAAVSPFAATAQYANAPSAGFPAPLVAPVASPQLFAPDPYSLPKRRVKVPSEVDFRRSSRGVHWGRWLFAFALLTTGVLVAYRQSYLREGARRIGLENKYLYSEKRVVGWVTAKAPGALQAALRQLKLLPAGAAAAAALTPSVAVAVVAPAAPTAVAPETVKAATPTTPPATDPTLKTVSLDSLPVLGGAPAAEPAEPVAAPKARAVTRREPAPKVSAKPRKQEAAVRKQEAPAPKPKAKAEPAPAPKAAKAPPPTMSSPLKAAIWQAMQEEAKKGK